MLAVFFACPVRILDLNNAGKLGAGPGFILMKKEKNPPFVNFFISSHQRIPGPVMGKDIVGIFSSARHNFSL